MGFQLNHECFLETEESRQTSSPATSTPTMLTPRLATEIDNGEPIITYSYDATSQLLTSPHPHLLKLCVAEEFYGRRLLLLMELADGTILDRWKQFLGSQTAFPLAELVRQMRQAAQALDHLHNQGFIHGGINPEDILLVDGEVKVADPGPLVASFHAMHTF